MWQNFYDKLKGLNLGKKLIIFTHNLGSFDGYFMLRSHSLFNYTNNPKEISPLIDNKNKFITIGYKYSIKNYLSEEQLADKGIYDEKFKNKKDYFNWTFLDSYRLFPISLNEFFP